MGHLPNLGFVYTAQDFGEAHSLYATHHRGVNVGEEAAFSCHGQGHDGGGGTCVHAGAETPRGVGGWVGGWVEEEQAVRMSCRRTWMGEWANLLLCTYRLLMVQST